ncbi:GerAB/ArcD/ProY family transporter [Paenibacillus lutrae]|uniref:GerAB/ArcD/ProY family transporter n=1 Tax=Paenibacillus lutrae TaxID=2078573 RepID=A0A7X3FF91_9BACL|nr:GerAB/ArcD/ProY family transporter [Paenibacillus lutrae]MVO98559.1 GerAB/ArcD/ProY family transporter [Paenibacillus lutrae]
MSYPRISATEWFVILTVSSIAMGPIRFPAYLAKQMDQHGWVLLLAALSISLWNTYIAVALSRKHSGESITEWSRHYLGKPLAAVYTLCIAIYFFVWGMLTFAEHWLLTSYSTLKETPVYLIVLLMLPVVLYMLLQGLEAWARLFLLLGYVLVIWLIVINLPQLVNSDFSNLLPLGNFGIDKMAGMNALTIFYLFKGFAVLYFLYPYLKTEKRLFGLSALATGVAGMELLFAFLLPLTVFGAKTAKTFTFPYQESMETVPFYLLPFEKLSFIAPLFFVLVTIMILIVSISCCTQAICSLFPRLREKTVSTLITIMMGLTLLQSLSVHDVDFLVLSTAIVFGILFFLVPNYMWMVSLFKKENPA